MKKYMIEICANSVESAVEAQKGGADRVELCAGMPEGGTTPSYGEITTAREMLTTTALNVIIRPRGGDFLYDKTEQRIMLRDIEMACEVGVDGVVFGCLTPEGDVDKEVMKELIRAAGGKPVTFHRAFDMCRDPYKALDDLISLGCKRILTSGQQDSAEKGISLLKELVTRAGNDIIIMPGCGVNKNNIAKLAKETGAKEFHFSARETIGSKMVYRNPTVSMGGTVHIDEYEIQKTSAEVVRETIGVLGNSANN